MISAVVESLAKTDIWSVGGNAQVDQDSHCLTWINILTDIRGVAFDFAVSKLTEALTCMYKHGI